MREIVRLDTEENEYSNSETYEVCGEAVESDGDRVGKLLMEFVS